jgi:hypothetical protein
MSNNEILRVLSPLVFFLMHVIYLVTLSHDPFLNKWIDGSFTFFVALVMCNVIRARIAARSDQSGPSDTPGHEGDGSEPKGTH